MSDVARLALAGSTGLVGRRVIEACVGRDHVRLVALARRETSLPRGARMEMFVADPERWGEVLAATGPAAMICALGTTWKQAGQDESAFRAVDRELVLDIARRAKAAGIESFVFVSSVGADSGAKQLYLRVKGEVERELARIGFERLHILRPSLLRGPREGDPRPLEKLGMLLAPLFNLFLHGKYRAYRAVDARIVAAAALSLSLRKTKGRFTHEYDTIVRAAREWPGSSAG